MIKTMKDSERDAILAAADLMVAAAKTAPKGSGRDTVVAAVVTGEDKDKLRDAMLEFGQECGEDFIIRDAGNVDNSECVVLIGCISNIPSESFLRLTIDIIQLSPVMRLRYFSYEIIVIIYKCEIPLPSFCRNAKASILE